MQPLKDLKQEEIPLVFMEFEKRKRAATEKILKEMGLKWTDLDQMQYITAEQIGDGRGFDYAGLRFCVRSREIRQYLRTGSSIIAKKLFITNHKIKE